MKVKLPEKLKVPFIIVKHSVVSFINDNVIKLCASLSYYTVFSLPPLFIIMIALCSVFLGKDAVQGELFYEIKSLVGSEVAYQIQEIIKHLKIYNNNGLVASVGGIMLFIGASGVFSEIQSSINLIWHIPSTKKENSILKFLKNKLLSFAMIGSVSFLLIVCLAINTFMDVLNKRLELLFKDTTVVILYIVNMVLVFIVITVLFLLIFRTLPNKTMKWKYLIVASCTTSFLFMIGKYLIGLYLGNSRMMSIYGAAGTLIVLLIWVYYSAIILYFGAELAKSYARSNHEFEPSEHPNIS